MCRTAYGLAIVDAHSPAGHSSAAQQPARLAPKDCWNVADPRKAQHGKLHTCVIAFEQKGQKAGATELT